MDTMYASIQAYAAAYSSPEPPLLRTINNQTNEEVPGAHMLSGHLQGRVLASLSRMIRPRRILEIGTYTGYSALCLAEGLTEDGRLYTIDHNENLAPRVTAYFNNSAYGSRICYQIGAALSILPTLDEMFDLIFIDADKKNYPHYYELALEKITPRGFIIVDNVLWKGTVCQVTGAESQDRHTQTLIAFNNKVQNDPRTENVLFPVRDGLVLYNLCMAYAVPTQAQNMVVPRRMGFANMQLQIAPEARAAIQTKVTSLTRSPKHYREVMERINLYMSIIERILKEEGIPDDLKYVVIQESHLVADDISSTNAVGFWQFKQEGALEVGVRIDRYIDERMHIVASTRAFAKYVKKHYSHFNNWLYALLAFHLGRGGAKAYIKEQRWDIDSSVAIIDQRAHWYIYHFLAHKLVFRDAIGKELHPELYLYECKDCQGKTIHEISQQFGVTLPKLRDYNKWLKPNKIPEDVTCAVLIPLTHQQYAQLDPLSIYNPLAKYKINYGNYWHTAQNFPQVSAFKQRSTRKDFIEELFAVE
eukprot:gene757-937_t